MNFFHIALVFATFLCSVVAGFLFAFAVVVMPGIKNLGNGDFIRAFQVMDGIIQDNHPLFMLVWVGSVVALIGSAMLGFGSLDAGGRSIMISAVVVYLLGVQLPTITINVPLNNELQSVDVATFDDATMTQARAKFEPRWIKWNVVRTCMSCFVTFLLLALLLRL